MTVQDLIPFCSVDTTRSGLVHPFTRGAYTYASDGRIMVRVSAMSDVETHPESPADLESVIPDRVNYRPAALPDGWHVFQAKQETCDECEGSGLANVACTNCNGAGEWFDDEAGSHHHCRPCHGTGLLPGTNPTGPKCGDCQGKGMVDSLFPVALDRGAIAISLHYLRLIQSLPGLGPLFYREPCEPIIADFQGGIVVMMPVRKTLLTPEAIETQWP